ncbi:hypothetical protein G9A89_004187 [Geosiphon pyriformis]|nr:hypothetical protein G9A89_004187 [Geosiphon pyriformis]
MSTSNVTLAFGHFPFQSKQKKRSTRTIWQEITESEREQEVEEEEKSEDQEFTYQNPILENLEIETQNF